MAANKSYDLSMGEKYMLSIREAAVYFGIGIKQLRRFAENNEGGFAMRYGNRFLICRPRFEAYLTKLMTMLIFAKICQLCSLHLKKSNARKT